MRHSHGRWRVKSEDIMCVYDRIRQWEKIKRRMECRYNFIFHFQCRIPYQHPVQIRHGSGVPDSWEIHAQCTRTYCIKCNQTAYEKWIYSNLTHTLPRSISRSRLSPPPFLFLHKCINFPEELIQITHLYFRIQLYSWFPLLRYTRIKSRDRSVYPTKLQKKKKLAIRFQWEKNHAGKQKSNH